MYLLALILLEVMSKSDNHYINELYFYVF